VLASLVLATAGAGYRWCWLPLVLATAGAGLAGAGYCWCWLLLVLATAGAGLAGASWCGFFGAAPAIPMSDTRPSCLRSVAAPLPALQWYGGGCGRILSFFRVGSVPLLTPLSPFPCSLPSCPSLWPPSVGLPCSLLIKLPGWNLQGGEWGFCERIFPLAFTRRSPAECAGLRFFHPALLFSVLFSLLTALCLLPPGTAGLCPCLPFLLCCQQALVLACWRLV
jgi:hypothetical protein